MISKIKDYTTTYKTLFFLEALFPTIAIKNNLKYRIIEELRNIKYRNTFVKQDINADNLYHPIKDLNQHILFRKV